MNHNTASIASVLKIRLGLDRQDFKLNLIRSQILQIKATLNLSFRTIPKWQEHDSTSRNSTNVSI